MRSSKSFKRLLFVAALLGAFVCSGRVVHAAPVTFAQFQQASNSDNAGFTYLDNGPGSDAQFVSQYNQVNQAAIPVIFNFLNIPSLPSTLQGPLQANLVLRSSTTQPVNTAFSGAVGDQQVLGGGRLADVLTITLVTPVNGLSNLLSMTFTGQLVGAIGGRTPQLSGNTDLGYTVNFTSDFLAFTPQAEQDYSLTFTSWTSLDGGGLEIDSLDNFFNTASAQGTGTFDSSTLPTLTGGDLPEPSMCMVGLIGISGFLLGRKRRKASNC